MRTTRSGCALQDGAILVTGAAGFVAGHLMHELNMGRGDVATDVSDDYPVPEGVRKVRWPLPSEASAELGDFRYVIHLAAMSSVSSSLSEVHRAYETNLMGTISVLEYIVSGCPEARLLFISSGEVYGSSDDPMSEDATINPYNPYGTTKAAAEIAIRQFAGNYDLDTVVSRSFPHFGPGQSLQFALPSFCSRIITAGREGKDTIATGNLDPIRDYLYVSDVVRAYACLLSGGTRGRVYNVCSGCGTTMGSLVETLIRISGLELRVEVDRNLFRVADISTQVGSPSRLLSLGWQQQRSLESGLTTLFEWWEARV